MPVNPGRLRQRITIQTVERVVTPGGYEDTWTDQQRVWANVAQPSPSGAARYAQAGYTNVTHEVTLRAGPSLSLGGTRFTVGARTLEPVAPPRDSDQAGRFVTIACRELNDGET